MDMGKSINVGGVLFKTILGHIVAIELR